MIDFLRKIDYKMLGEQKQALLVTIDNLEKKREKENAEHLTGILHLIDSIQDKAVEEGFPENEVFPKQI